MNSNILDAESKKRKNRERSWWLSREKRNRRNRQEKKQKTKRGKEKSGVLEEDKKIKGTWGTLQEENERTHAKTEAKRRNIKWNTIDKENGVTVYT